MDKSRDRDSGDRNREGDKDKSRDRNRKGDKDRDNERDKSGDKSRAFLTLIASTMQYF
jgi:transcription termination factor Rho